MKKALSLLKYVLLAIGLGTLVYVLTTGEAGVGVMLTWGYILLGIAALTAMLFPLFNLSQNPKAAMRSLLGVGIVAVVLVIAYSLSSSEPFMLPSKEVYDNSAGLKFTDTGLYTAYVAFFGAIVVAVLGEIRNSFK